MISKYFNDRSYCYRGPDFTVSDWLEIYQKYQSENPELVEIIKVDEENGSYIMEEINGFPLSDYSSLRDLQKVEIRRTVSHVIGLWGRMQNWYPDGRRLFIHKDYNLNNIMYDFDRKHIRLIDPDAFCLESPKHFTPNWHGFFIDTLYNMREWEKLT